MKKIVEGKMYDTDTASQVGYHTNGCYPGDFNYTCETLYKKRTGEYFLHAEGGARSCYGVSYANGQLSYGEHIIPMPQEKARQWAEKCLNVDEYESEFGEVEE